MRWLFRHKFILHEQSKGIVIFFKTLKFAVCTFSKGIRGVVRPSITSISYHIFEARDLRLGTQTPHPNATEHIEGS